MLGLPFAAILLAAAAAPGDDDPLLALLAQDDDPGRRGVIQDLLRAGEGDGCARLSTYARARDARARENAVRAMGDAGCAGIEDYRPYFSDGSAWIADALLEALSRNRVHDGVPYALARLADRRRLVTHGGSWTVAQSADRTLRALTAQPIPSARPPEPGDAPAPAEAAWRAWYSAHGDEPAEDWIASGLARMRESLAADSASLRLDALETAALVGEPGREVLAGALRRAPSDLAASLVCVPDEPPRVTDQVPCVLSVKNVASRRVALAPGEVRVELTARGPDAGAPGASRREESRKGAPKKQEGKAGARASAATALAPAADAGALGGRMVDLGPGESLQRPVRIGPVVTAGRYEAKVALADLWGSLDPGPYESPPIEAALIVRFEQ